MNFWNTVDLASFQFFGITFYTYGLIVGIALWVGVSLAEKVAKDQDIDQAQFWQLIWHVLIPGLVAARMYHVATDWYLYTQNWWAAFMIWKGGLSIIGGVIGGLIGAWIFLKKTSTSGLKLGQVLDIAVFGLPVAQVIGRWGNFVNHELYGGTTNLPWKLFIPEVHRLPEYRSVEFYHPLFAYEQLLLLPFIIFIWYRYQQKKIQPQDGSLFIWYIWYYSLIRFGLDFIRLSKGSLIWGLGINQWILLGVWLVSSLILIGKRSKTSVGV